MLRAAVVAAFWFVLAAGLGTAAGRLFDWIPLREAVVSGSLLAAIAWLAAPERSWSEPLVLPEHRATTAQALALGLCGACAAFATTRFYARFVPSAGNGSAALQALYESLRRALADRPCLTRAAVVVQTFLSAGAEEILFRRHFLGRVRSALGVPAAIAASAVLFGAVHLNAATFPAIAAGGAIYAIVYEVGGDLRASVLAHALYNLAMKRLLGVI